MDHRNHRERRPDIEPLETRALLVGFYDGPAPLPVYLNLHGTLGGTSVVQLAAGHRPEVLRLNGSGRISPLGKTSVSGTLNVTGHFEQGTLVLNASRSRLVVHVAGVSPLAGTAAGSSTLAFNFSGRGAASNPNFAYQSELGGGSARFTLAPGTGARLSPWRSVPDNRPATPKPEHPRGAASGSPWVETCHEVVGPASRTIRSEPRSDQKSRIASTARVNWLFRVPSKYGRVNCDQSYRASGRTQM